VFVAGWHGRRQVGINKKRVVTHFSPRLLLGGMNRLKSSRLATALVVAVDRRLPPTRRELGWPLNAAAAASLVCIAVIERVRLLDVAVKMEARKIPGDRTAGLAQSSGVPGAKEVV
jgi:hypothetical protein